MTLRQRIITLCLLTGVAIFGASNCAHPEASISVLRADSAPWLPGVNIAGAEFTPDGNKLGEDYHYPSSKEMDYYASKGMRLFRIPFLAERVIQPTLTLGPRLTPEMDRLTELIDHAATRNAYVILDMHDYGRIFTAGLIGRDPGASEDFAAAWGLIAARVRNRPNVIFGLMNEPHKQSAREWLPGANAAIAAIRDAGADQMILVPGSHWSGAHSWLRTDNSTVMQNVVDPMDNFAYDVHQYLDGNSSGTSPEVVQGAGASRLVGFTKWARMMGRRAILGEFGWADTPEAHAEGEALLAYMSENRDVWFGWTYWAGGAWWGDYMFSVEPKDGEDRPQMSILEKFMQ